MHVYDYTSLEGIHAESFNGYSLVHVRAHHGTNDYNYGTYILRYR